MVCLSLSLNSRASYQSGPKRSLPINDESEGVLGDFESGGLFLTVAVFANVRKTLVLKMHFCSVNTCRTLPDPPLGTARCRENWKCKSIGKPGHSRDSGTATFLGGPGKTTFLRGGRQFWGLSRPRRGMTTFLGAPGNFGGISRPGRGHVHFLLVQPIAYTLVPN